ncbi:uracil-DNA glycosylase family protein [Sphingopyxis sp.]|uniref:uracil-DNA glycosylase family protein n=1 Tax=Sphingopyxis sp. TaxID=1908224 RepID=UPI00260566D1|nr:uracil-DNA glycosylase family protein [Sphingopyxis sp.]MCW0199826.1 uracil-DNA glycosylase family protein [Sphingopyxis sp.]
MQHASAKPIDRLLDEIARCDACSAQLSHGVRPVLQASATARLLIASQAPGSKVHKSGIPFSDRSGDRLREWTGLSSDKFYDPALVAIVPMGFCYPGRGQAGDAPPRPECAPLWRDRLLSALSAVRLTLLVGSYAQNAVLGLGTVGDRVRRYRDFLPHYFPLPHPSWRSQVWMRQNPWFEIELLPELRRCVTAALPTDGE